MTPVRVGVNLLWLVPGVVGGSEEYTTRLLRGLAEDLPADLHVTLFALPSFAEAHPDLVAAYPTVTAPLSGANRAARVLAESTWLARQARTRRIDLMHHAGGVIPPGRTWSRLPGALTIHDLQPLVMPENFGGLKRRWLHAMLPRSAARATVVFTPSDPTSADVARLLGVAPERTCTVPHGIEPWPMVTPEEVARVASRYRLGAQTILYPAITYAHKDHQTLIAAFARLAPSRGDLTLVLTGGEGPAEADVVDAIGASGVAAQIRRAGRVSWPDLHGLYAGATAVAVPSRFEGFGAPALEAMAAGVPVAVADATALPWVVGNAGMKVAPGDVGAWADALGRIVDDPRVHDTMAAAGLVRAKSFGWAEATDSLVAGYRLAASLGKTGA